MKPKYSKIKVIGEVLKEFSNRKGVHKMTTTETDPKLGGLLALYKTRQLSTDGQPALIDALIAELERVRVTAENELGALHDKITTIQANHRNGLIALKADHRAAVAKARGEQGE